ncbi:MAG: trypsin-like peptidase domain-containing protein [Candidatus Yanofskybacteria bacterium]|nr:trypsin-like peptidase domain-containing protein [Candidatus Yanofskybacteria bacterium]
MFLTLVYPDNKMEAYLSRLYVDDDDPSLKQELTPTPSPSPAPDLWERISSEASFSSVAVQVFKDNRSIKSGSGIILSADGLIIVPADLTALGGIYQILYEDKVAKGIIVSFDIKRNLAIIKIINPEFDLNVSSLNTNLVYQSGQDVLIAGKLADRLEPVAISQRGIISYVSGDNIILDTFTNSSLVGSKVLNSRGELVGALYIRGGKSYVISSKDIDAFFKEYLNKTQ